MQGKPCEIWWCGALSTDESIYCAIHAKYPHLRMETADRSWKKQRAHEAAVRRAARVRARKAEKAAEEAAKSRKS